MYLGIQYVTTNIVWYRAVLKQLIAFTKTLNNICINRQALLLLEYILSLYCVSACDCVTDETWEVDNKNNNRLKIIYPLEGGVKGRKTQDKTSLPFLSRSLLTLRISRNDTTFLLNQQSEFLTKEFENCLKLEMYTALVDKVSHLVPMFVYERKGRMGAG